MGDGDGGGAGAGGVGGDFGGVRKFSSSSTISSGVNHSAFVDVSQKKALLGGSTKREKNLLIVVLLLTLLILIFIILIAVFAAKYSRIRHKPKVCFKEECVTAAASLQASIDDRVDPCVDFHKFTCGRWHQAHPTPEFATSHDWFAIHNTNKLRAVRDNLKAKSTDDDPEVLHQLRLLYATCADLTKADSQSIKPLWRVLEKQGVTAPLPTPANESFPTVTPPSADATPFRLQKTLMAALSMGIPLFLDMAAVAVPENRSDVRLAIDSASTDNILPGYPNYEELVGRRLVVKRRGRGPLRMRRQVDLDDDDFDGNVTFSDDDDDDEEPISEEEVKWAARCMAFVYGFEEAKRTGDVTKLEMYTKDDFLTAARRVLEFARDLRELIEDAKQTSQWSMVSLEDIQADWNNITKAAGEWLQVSWHDVLWMAQRELLVPTPFRVEEKGKIIVGKEGYLSLLAGMLAEAGPQTVNDYLWWTIVKSLGFYTSETLRGYKEKYMDAVYDDYSPPTRSLFCASSLHKLLPDIATYSLYTVNDVENATERVAGMMGNIMSSFARSVRRSSWLDRETKKNALKKLKYVRIVVGAPDYTYGWYSMDAHHRRLTFKKESFLEDMLYILYYRQYMAMSQLFKSNATTGWDGSTGPLDANAFYSEDANTILVPLGILKFPFSGNGLEAMDYGSLGSILGHELSHAFDDTGRLYDHEGNFKSWWTNSSTEEYENRSSCFVQQYDRLVVPDTGGLTVLGKLTLSENIADNGGLTHAYSAFKKAKSRRGSGEPSLALPGLERFSEDQLFFLAYANSWCETWSQRSQLASLVDAHAPTYARVTVPLRNSRAFSHAFKCSKGAPMRPKDEDTCALW